MFTGIITSTGKIKKIEQNTKNRSAIKVSVDLGKDSKGLFIIVIIMKKKIIFVKFFFLFYLRFVVHRVDIG